MSLKLEPVLSLQEQDSAKEEHRSNVDESHPLAGHPGADENVNTATRQRNRDHEHRSQAGLNWNLDPVFFMVAAIATVGLIASLLTLYLRSDRAVQQHLNELKVETAALEARISASENRAAESAMTEILPTDELPGKGLIDELLPRDDVIAGAVVDVTERIAVEKSDSPTGSMVIAASTDVSLADSIHEPAMQHTSAVSGGRDDGRVSAASSAEIAKTQELADLQHELEKLRRVVATQSEQIEFLAQENHDLRLAARFESSDTGSQASPQPSWKVAEESQIIADMVEPAHSETENDIEVADLLSEVPQRIDKVFVGADLLVAGIDDSGESGDGSGAISISNRELTELVVNGYNAYIKGDYPSAGKWYDKAMHLDPYSRDANLGVAAIASLQGHNKLAENRYRHLLSLNPDDKTAFSALLMLASAENAIEYELLALVEQQARDRAGLYAVLGHYYSQQRRWAESTDAYRKSHAADSVGMTSADNYFNLAVSLDNLGQVGDAATYYQQALNAGGEHSFDRTVVQSRLRLILNQP